MQDAYIARQRRRVAAQKAAAEKAEKEAKSR